MIIDWLINQFIFTVYIKALNNDFVYTKTTRMTTIAKITIQIED